VLKYLGKETLFLIQEIPYVGW
jgi:hypothetical protein